MDSRCEFPNLLRAARGKKTRMITYLKSFTLRTLRTWKAATLSNRSATTVGGGGILSFVAKWNSCGLVTCFFKLQNTPNSPLLPNICSRSWRQIYPIEHKNKLLISCSQGQVHTFLSNGLALNLGIFSSASCSISRKLFARGGRALSDVCRTGVFGSVR